MTFDLHRISVAAAATICLAFPLAGVAQSSAPMQGVLGLSSSASVDVVKDVLVVTFAASKEGNDAASVQSQLKQALAAALGEAKKVARPGEVDVQTGKFSIWPRYASAGSSSSRTTISGWQGSAQLVVEGRDMTTIAALTGRISTMSISSVGYELSREASHKVEADVAAQAIARFRAKAEDYAKQFGYSGYAIREVTVAGNDAGFRPQPMPMRAMASVARSEPLPVEPGKATVTATVNGTVQMK